MKEFFSSMLTNSASKTLSCCENKDSSTREQNYYLLYFIQVKGLILYTIKPKIQLLTLYVTHKDFWWIGKKSVDELSVKIAIPVY